MTAEWMIALASAGGSALLGAATTDMWRYARDGIAGLFRRGGAHRPEVVVRWLDEDADAVAQAPVDDRERISGALAERWSVRLADLLAEHPELADELRALTGRLTGDLPEHRRTWVQANTAEGSATQYNVQHGSLTVHNGRDGAPA